MIGNLKYRVVLLWLLFVTHNKNLYVTILNKMLFIYLNKLKINLCILKYKVLLFVISVTKVSTYDFTPCILKSL